MRTYKTTQVFVAACAGLAFFGVAMLSLGPILGQLNAQVEGANSLPSTMSIGIILGTILFGPVVDRFGYKWLLIIGSLLSLAGLQVLAGAREIGLLHGAMAMIGFGGGVLNGLTNALVSDIYDDDKRGGRLGILGAFYCVGALLWTLLNYFIPNYIVPLHCMSAIMAVFIVYFFFIGFPQAKPQGSVSVSKSLGLLKYPTLLLFAFILFFQSGFEGASGSFTPKFLEDGAGMGSGAAVLSLTWFTVGMLCGRLPLGVIMKKLKDNGTLYLYLTVALVGVAILYFDPGVTLAHLAMAMIGFGVGATYPVVLAYLGGVFREQSGTAFSIAIFIALCGQFAFNKVVGVMFYDGGYAYFPLVLAFAVVMMMLLLPVAAGTVKKKK